MRRKITGVILAVSVFAGSLTGCSLFTSKDRAAIEEKADTFMSEILQVRYERAARTVLDGDEHFMKKLPDDNKQLTLMEEVMYNSTYEIGEIEVHKMDKEATCLVTVSYSDVEAITAGGDLLMGEVITAVDEKQEITETELTVNFVYEDDEWSVDPDSASDIIIFFSDLCEDLPLGGINEENSIEFAQQFIGMMAGGSGMDALAMAGITEDDVIDALDLEYYFYDNDIDQEITDSLDEMMAAYFSTYEPTYTAQYVNDNTYGVSISGDAVDDMAAIQELMLDEDSFVPLFADLLEPFAAVYDSYDFNIDLNSFFSSYADIYTTALQGCTATADKSFYVEVTCDDYGNYSIVTDGCGDILPDCIENLFSILEGVDESTMLAAVELLHDEGRMSDAAYQSIASQYWETELPEGMELFIPAVYEDAVYQHEAFFTGNMVCFGIETWDYSDAGDIYRYDLMLDDEPLVEGGTYESPTDYSDVIFISYDFGDEIPEGTISLTVYTEGASSQTVLIQLYLVPEGSDTVPDDPGSGSGSGSLRFDTDD